ncbi:MAG: hypothetical protein U1C18_00485, partial [Patescibacteria group bacterium]|nr:hypothetical protein [Patescibacteria group bacterium]
ALEISSTMKSENSELADYFDQGYVLRDACIDSNTGLLFFDFSAGLKSNYNTVSESELAELGKQVLLGVSDAEYNNVNIYPATLPDSFLCYIGDTCTTCSLDTLTNDNILFQCRNSNNGYRHYAWYAHNTETGESTTVKEVTESWVYGGIISPEEERESYQKKEKIYHEDYLELFRNKTADLKY